MKNYILIFTFLFSGFGLFAQSADMADTSDDWPVLEQSVSNFTALYNLDENQQEKMAEIQERKYRNLDEIEGLKTTDPQKYRKKIEAMQLANRGHMHQLLNEEQLKLFRKREVALRRQKAEVFHEMKGSSQADMEARLAEMDVEALLNG